MKILGIETSCDETGLGLIEIKGGINKPSFKILKNLVASQIKIHRPYGGIVPFLAKREHIKKLPVLLARTIHNSKFIIPDLIAVTVGPGLEPCLWQGINFAKKVYKELKTKNKKLRILGINHLEGHLYSFLLNSKFTIHNSKFIIQDVFPAVGLIVSGGHTILLLMKDLTRFKKLGETRDDAAGEAFDKIARLLHLPYPGGPEIEKIAIYGNPNSIDFPRPMINQKNYDFSFSGLKTAVYYYLHNKQQITSNKKQYTRHKIQKADIAASVQQAIIDVLVCKTINAAKEFKANSIILAGGVASNNFLRKEFKLKIKNLKLKINFIVPPKKFCVDNGIMIALAGYFNYLTNKKYPLTAKGGLGIKSYD